MKYYGRDVQSHRNYTEMKQRTTVVNSEVTVRPITDVELEKFKHFEPEIKEGKRRERKSIN